MRNIKKILEISENFAKDQKTWSTKEVNKLRELAQKKWSTPDIAKELDRSESSIRNKAHKERIPLSPKDK